MLHLVIGLGNPGPRFSGTRHNAGFEVVERYAGLRGAPLRKPPFRRYRAGGVSLPGGSLLIAQPLTFMNRSGDVVAALMRRAGAAVSDMIIVCDNMDLPVGAVRLKKRGTAGNHNGVRSVMERLGTGEFPRLYVGVGRPSSGEDVVSHVLSAPATREEDSYQSALTLAADALCMLEELTVEEVAGRINRRIRG